MRTHGYDDEKRRASGGLVMLCRTANRITYIGKRWAELVQDKFRFSN